MNKIDEVKLVNKVSITTMIGNFILALFKFIAGLLMGSAALVSDAIHSTSDVVSTVIVMIGVKFSNKNEDEDHPFGHERFEPVAAIILSIMLLGVGVFIGYGGVETLITYYKNKADYVSPISSDLKLQIVGLVAAVVSIIVKEGMYWYTYLAAKKINSSALKADAWHHRSDALSSIGSTVGIIGVICGCVILDAYASLVITVFIVISSISIFREALEKMVDKSASEKDVNIIEEATTQVEGVIKIDSCKTRQFGSRIYVEIEIQVDGDLTVKEGHIIAENVHNAVENCLENIKHCVVHVNPNN